MLQWCRAPSPDAVQYPKLEQLISSAAMLSRAPLGQHFPPPCALASSDFCKATFKKTAASCEGTDHLSTLSAACFLEPRLLEVDRGPRAAPPPNGLFQHGTSDGVMQFLRQWDEHGRLALFPSGTVPRGEWGELFEVVKDADATRVVFNRIPRNYYEVHLPGAAASTPSGIAFVDVQLHQGEELRLFTEDVSDY